MYSACSSTLGVAADWGHSLGIAMVETHGDGVNRNPGVRLQLTELSPRTLASGQLFDHRAPPGWVVSQSQRGNPATLSFVGRVTALQWPGHSVPLSYWYL